MKKQKLSPETVEIIKEALKNDTPSDVSRKLKMNINTVFSVKRRLESIDQKKEVSGNFNIKQYSCWLTGFKTV